MPKTRARTGTTYYDPSEIEPAPIHAARMQLLQTAAQLFPAMMDELATQVLPVAVEGLQADDPKEFSSLWLMRGEAEDGGDAIQRRRHYWPLAAAANKWAEKWDKGGNSWIVLAALETAESWARGAPQSGTFLFRERPSSVEMMLDEQIERHPELRTERSRILAERLKILEAQKPRTFTAVIDPTKSVKENDSAAFAAIRETRKWLTELRKTRGLIGVPLISAQDYYWTASYHFGKVRFSKLAAEKPRIASDPADMIRQRVRTTAEWLRMRLRQQDARGRIGQN